MWILIVLFALPGNMGHDSTGAAFQEFSSEQACLAASKTIVDTKRGKEWSARNT